MFNNINLMSNLNCNTYTSNQNDLYKYYDYEEKTDKECT